MRIWHVFPVTLSLVLGWGACKKDKDADGDTDTTDTDVSDSDRALDGCGDGVVDPEEACDDGDANSDEAPDACRTTCVLPACGDGVTDEGEQCDDGNLLGGDGCAPACETESLPGEVEPNDTWRTSTPTSGTVALGGLRDRDVDCWSVDVQANGWLSATASGPDGSCPPDLGLRMYDSEGDALVVILAGDDEEGRCARIDPSEEDDAAYLDAGTYHVCVEGLFLTAVPAYRLQIETGDDSCLGFDPPPEDDPDGDGLANNCDSDDDGDGVPDTLDICPLVSDGPSSPVARTNGDGFIRHWMIAPGFPADPVGSDGDCDPSDTSRLGDDDATAVPALGDEVQGTPFRIIIDDDGTMDFTDYSSLAAPREVYAVTWIHTEDPIDAVLHVGVDDGGVAWVDGVQVGSTSECQGVVVDDHAWPVFLDSGWHRVVIKNRDQGGGWGLVARFKDTNGTVLNGYEVSPVGPQRWVRDQADRDNDDIGDVCDPEP